MLLKFASMFLANIFYCTKIILKIKKRDTRLSHFRILLKKVYNIYFKINSSITDTKLHHSANKMLFLLCLVSLSNFLTNSIASLGLSVVLINCSKSLVSISSLLLISESCSFFNTQSLINFGCFLLSSIPKN